jgi:hypothetical protein
VTSLRVYPVGERHAVYRRDWFVFVTVQPFAWFFDRMFLGIRFLFRSFLLPQNRITVREVHSKRLTIADKKEFLCEHCENLCIKILLERREYFQKNFRKSDHFA